ncbi:MAG TPA: toll/interleukin-1 receptor domain-containing protein, partial [Thermoanaerobaculia bacterium]|nr:toll/interleukin-1 receptor domain-containing protein [Thermoanaerobaculia bacterium]
NVEISLISAGKQDGQYKTRLHDLRWDHLYEKKKFGAYLEKMRAEWKKRYDFVLIDSRTGVSDIGSISTIQMPDTVLLFFTPNEQSVTGSMDVARSADTQRRKSDIDRSRLLFVPVPSRFDKRVEKETADLWLKRFAKECAPLFKTWAHADVTPEQLLTFIRVPYVAYWSYGERLPVIEEGTRDPESIGYAFETLAALLAHRLSETEVLVHNRDSYVAAARVGATQSTPAAGDFDYSFFVAYAKEDAKYATQLVGALKQSGMNAFLEEAQVTIGEAWLDATTAAMQTSRHFVLIVGEHLTAWQKQLALSFFSLTLSESTTTRRLLTVALPGTGINEVPTVLRQGEVIRADLHEVRATAQAILRAVRGRKSSPDDPQKGQWGEKSEGNGRRISAEVKPSRDDDDWFEIELRLEAIDPAKSPLTGEVTFHLHDTFDPPMLSATAKNNVATLTLGAYGAFTVGVEADGGATRLELDLSELPSAPAKFRLR